MKISRAILVAILTAMVVGGTSHGQALGGSSGFSPDRVLVVTHAAIDPTTSDLLVISNSWRDVRMDLRRFHPDGLADSGFILERYETCCAVHPALVAVDPEGNIYTLEYTGELGGFYLYKHAPTGRLDIEWGQREGLVESLHPMSSTGDSSGYSGGVGSGDEDEGNSGGGYEGGETALDWNAGGGRMHIDFQDPADLIARSDGSLLVLDRYQRYVYLISADGRSMSYFMGRQGYYPVRPQRLLMDSEGYLYLIDSYDRLALNRENMVGVFRFSPDGEQEFGWGEGSSGINDPWRSTLDINTLVVDGGDNLIALGGDIARTNHGEVFVFDRTTGAQVGRNTVQYRTGYDQDYLGILGRPEGGFVVLERFSFQLLVNYYSADGVRESQIRIDDLYSAE